MLSSIIYTIYIFTSLSNGIILSDTAIVDHTQNITITTKIDTCSDIASIIITGASIPLPFGISFNSNSIPQPYLVFVSNTNDNTNAKEYKSNISIPSMISLNNNHKSITNDNYQTIILSRNRIGITSDHYTFPNTTSSFKLSWLFSDKSTKVKGSKQLTLRENLLENENFSIDNCEAMPSIQSNQCVVGNTCDYDSDCCENMKCEQNKCYNIKQTRKKKSEPYNKFKDKQFYIYWAYHISYWGSYYLVILSIAQHLICTVIMVYYIWMKRRRFQ